MRRKDYQAGIRVKQRSNPGFVSQRKTGTTVSESLTQRRFSDGDDYCLVKWDGSRREEWVHFATLEIVPEVAA